MSTPIDLRKKFGHRWKIGLDESARGRWSDPWTYSIVCCHGEIIPWGGDLLAASTKNAGAIANRLRAAPFVEIGSHVEENTTVCLLEVMTVFTAVKAGVRGYIREICAESGDLVEYGQPLFWVEPENMKMRQRRKSGPDL